MKKLFTLFIVLTGLHGCKKADVTPCYTCIQFISFSSNSPKFPIPSPSSVDKNTCDEAEKDRLAKGEVTTESIGGTFTVTKTIQTVCRQTN